jgi:flagellar biosynthetic protein FliO
MVLVVFALLGGLLWFFKRRGLVSLPLTGRRGGNARRLEVLERISLSPQHALHLVRVADRIVLIGTAPSACTILDSPASQDASATQSLTRTAS